MTIQVCNGPYAKSKAALAAALAANASHVQLYDPSMFQGARGCFLASSMALGESFPVVMDHPKRTRFAIIKRKENGTFKVS